MQITLRTKTRNINFLLIENDGKYLITTSDGIVLGTLTAEDALDDYDKVLLKSMYITLKVNQSFDDTDPQVIAVQDNFVGIGIHYNNDKPILQV